MYFVELCAGIGAAPVGCYADDEHVLAARIAAMLTIEGRPKLSDYVSFRVVELLIACFEMRWGEYIRGHLFVLVLLVVWPCCGEEEFSDAGITNAVRMTIHLIGGGSTVETDQPFTLQICITNESTNRIIFVVIPMADSEDSGFFFSVISPTGNDIAKKRKPPLIDKGGNAVILKPGRWKAIEFDPTRICKFNRLGTYSITVRRQVLVQPDDRGIEITSKPFVLSVVPQK